MIKVVINNSYGGFSLTKYMCEQLKASSWDYAWDYKKRSDPKLVALVEEANVPKQYGYDDQDEDKEPFTDLVIVELPDETTDWTISEYDGAETVFYVVDGKIYRAYGDDDDDL